jgi:hypothetical protein
MSPRNYGSCGPYAFRGDILSHPCFMRRRAGENYAADAASLPAHEQETKSLLLLDQACTLRISGQECDTAYGASVENLRLCGDEEEQVPLNLRVIVIHENEFRVLKSDRARFLLRS